MNVLDNFYLSQPEPNRSCLLALRELILNHDHHLTAAWKYGMPFFCYKKKMCCYLWVHKKSNMPYLGIVNGNQVNHPALLQESRARMKILLIDAEKDLPVSLIQSLLSELIGHYTSGKIKT